MAEVGAIGGVTADGAQGGLAQTATNAFGLGFEDLLRIVLTQLTYQDPLKPMENFEFVSQLAQFSQIQQTETMNDRILGILQAQATNQATGVLGRLVDIPGRRRTAHRTRHGSVIPGRRATHHDQDSGWAFDQQHRDLARHARCGGGIDARFNSHRPQRHECVLRRPPADQQQHHQHQLDRLQIRQSDVRRHVRRCARRASWARRAADRSARRFRPRRASADRPRPRPRGRWHRLSGPARRRRSASTPAPAASKSNKDGYIVLAGTEYRLAMLDDTGAPSALSIDARAHQAAGCDDDRSSSPTKSPRRTATTSISPTSRCTTPGAASMSGRSPSRGATGTTEWKVKVTDRQGRGHEAQTLKFIQQQGRSGHHAS